MTNGKSPMITIFHIHDVNWSSVCPHDETEVGQSSPPQHHFPQLCGVHFEQVNPTLHDKTNCNYNNWYQVSKLHVTAFLFFIRMRGTILLKKHRCYWSFISWSEASSIWHCKKLKGVMNLSIMLYFLCFCKLWIKWKVFKEINLLILSDFL